MKWVKSFFRGILFSFLIISTPVHAGIDDKLTPYYYNYMLFVKMNCSGPLYKYTNLIGVSINFGDLEKISPGKNYAGLTEYKSNRLNNYYSAEITIDKKAWDKDLNEEEKIALIFHELTHALFKYPDLRNKKNAHHYMYYQINTVSKEELYKQVVKLLGQVCYH